MILMNFFSFVFGILDIFVICYSLIVKTVLKRKNVVLAGNLVRLECASWCVSCLRATVGFVDLKVHLCSIFECSALLG